VTTLVYVVREGDINHELRHSLRSVEANLPHDEVVIAGYVPTWVRNVHRIEVPQGPVKGQNTTKNLLAAAVELEAAGVTDAVLMNDDFYVVEPIEAVPVLHRGPVDAVIRETMLRIRGRTTGGWRSRWLQGMEDTRALLLAELGTEPLSYELHVPLPFEPAGMVETIEWCEAHMDRLRDGVPIHKRTVHGNLAFLGGSLMAEDPKVTYPSRLDWPDGPFVSTNDTTWLRHLVGARLREMFAEPSRYES
jgi:hypothetical protein